MINNMSDLEKAVGITKGNIKKYLIELTRCEGIWFIGDEECIQIGIIPEEDALYTKLGEVGPYKLNFPFSLNDYYNLIKKLEVKGAELLRETNEFFEQRDAHFIRIQEGREKTL